MTAATSVRTDSSYFRRLYHAEASMVPWARRELVEFAESVGAPAALRDRIALAASEALTNVVVHAHGLRGGTVELTAGRSEEELIVLVADDGRGLQPRRTSPGLGHGLALIAECSDELSILKRSTGGVEVVMRFFLGERSTGDPRYERGSVASATRPASARFSTTR